jgi:S1-C subfamily serine protease
MDHPSPEFLTCRVKIRPSCKIIILLVTILLGSSTLSWGQIDQSKGGGKRSSKPAGKQPVGQPVVPAGAGAEPREILRQQEPVGWVWVSQTFDLSKQIGEGESILTMDGEPLPSLLRRRVTLGLVIDNEGHIVTRLIDVSASSPPNDLSVRSLTTRPVAARFIGMDQVSGLCILKAEGGMLPTALFFSSPTLPASLEVRLYGFHPNQRMNLQANVVYTNPRRTFSQGKVVKATQDFRYQPNNPVYHLLSPRLTPIQDGSLVLGPMNRIFGMSIYDSNGQGPDLVYPISRIVSVANSIIQSKQSVTHGWLGATGVDATIGPSSAIYQPSLENVGVRITAVAPDSPAEKAGILPKDLLLALNDRRIRNYAQLVTAVRQLPAGSEIFVRVRRGSEIRVLKPTLIASPSIEPEQQLRTFAQRIEEMQTTLRGMEEGDPARLKVQERIEKMKAFLETITIPAPPSVRVRVFLGVETVPLSGQLMGYFAVTNGLLVTSVDEKSKAAIAGLQAGDIVTQVDSTMVTDIQSLSQSLFQSTREPLSLVIVRHREKKTIPLGALTP